MGRHTFSHNRVPSVLMRQLHSSARSQYEITDNKANVQSDPNCISIGSAVLAQLMAVSNRQTHRPRYICSNRPHLYIVRMRCGLIGLIFPLQVMCFEVCMLRF